MSLKDMRTLSQMAAELGRVRGWAPGSYTSKCGGCGREFEGDKRAYECLPCAVKGLEETAAEFHSALREINRWNDHPATFSAGIQKILDGVIVTKDIRFVGATTTHEFEPDKKYPWFCGHCGYPPHEALKHGKSSS